MAQSFAALVGLLLLLPACAIDKTADYCETDATCSSAKPNCDTKTHSCFACVSGDECSSSLCQADGKCANQEAIVYVNNNGGACSGIHTGAKSDPICQIGDGITTAEASARSTVLVAGSGTAYSAVSFNAPTFNIGPLIVLGPGRSAMLSARIAQTDNPALSVNIAGKNFSMAWDGLDFSGANGTTKTNGIECTKNPGAGTATLTIRNSFIHDSGADGVKSDGCSLVVESSSVANNGGVGLKLNGRFTVVNTFVSGNHSKGVSISSEASGLFLFNTIAFNQRASNGNAGIECGDGDDNEILNSIVVGNKLGNQGSQFSGNCKLLQTVTGEDSQAGAIKLTPTFVSATDFHLKINDSANAACCVDKRPMEVGFPTTDVDGSRRPKGAAWDIGAHEVQ